MRAGEAVAGIVGGTACAADGLLYAARYLPLRVRGTYRTGYSDTIFHGKNIIKWTRYYWTAVGIEKHSWTDNSPRRYRLTTGLDVHGLTIVLDVHGLTTGLDAHGMTIVLDVTD